MRMHTGERQLFCEWCTEQCLETYDLEKHMRVHAGEKTFYCGQCTKKFAETDGWEKHMCCNHAANMQGLTPTRMENLV